MLGGMRWFFFLDSRSYKVCSLQDRVNFLEKTVERKLLVQILLKLIRISRIRVSFFNYH